MVELVWRLRPDAAAEFKEQNWSRCSVLIEESTGEFYDTDALRNLPLAGAFGCLVLEAKNRPSQPLGLLFSMRLDETTARVLLFVVEPSLRNHGLGTLGWRQFSRRALQEGVKQVQLEVRSDNQAGQRFYQRQGLDAIGRLESYYRDGGVGLLLRGPLTQP